MTFSISKQDIFSCGFAIFCFGILIEKSIGFHNDFDKNFHVHNDFDSQNFCTIDINKVFQFRLPYLINRLSIQFSCVIAESYTNRHPKILSHCATALWDFKTLISNEPEILNKTAAAR